MKNCPNNHNNPDEARFCRICGYKFEENSNLPFHLRHPELHLKPISEFEELYFIFKSPEYVEEPTMSKNPEYLYIARKGKLGILHWVVNRYFYGKVNVYNRIIPCEYDRIDKADGHFVCYKGSQTTYIDLKGNILK